MNGPINWLVGLLVILGIIVALIYISAHVTFN